MESCYIYEDSVRLDVITCKNPNRRVDFDYVAEQSYKIEWFFTSKAAIRFSLTSRSRWRRRQVGIGGVFFFLVIRGFTKTVTAVSVRNAADFV